MDLKSLLFSFTGRINRGKWWLAALIFVGAGIVVGLIVGILAWMIPMLGIAVYVVYAVVAIIAGVAVGVKRLHDRNKSGMWLLAFYLVPGVLGVVGYMSGSEAISMLMSLISTAIFIWAFVELGCLRGTVGPNEYGPDPLEGAVPAHSV